MTIFSWFLPEKSSSRHSHSNGYELCPSSRRSRHLFVFIRNGFHTIFALNGKETLASRFNLTYRYIDDALSVNNPEFENYLGQMYPAELEIVIQEVLWSIRGSYSVLWSFPLTNVKWHSDPWPTVTSQPIRLSTNFMTLIPTLTFTELRVVSMEHLQQVWHASRERLPLRTPGSAPFEGLHMLWLLRPVSRLYIELMTVPNLTFTELREVSMEHLRRVWHASRESLPFRTPGSVPHCGLANAPIVETKFLELATFLIDFSPRILLGTFSILLISLVRSWSTIMPNCTLLSESGQLT